MVTVPLGTQAYARRYAGEPEIKLVNRYLEHNPTNLREHTALIARPGSTLNVEVLTGLGRSTFSKVGLFNGDLFVVFGTSLYRVSATGVTPITGTLANVGNGYCYATWMKGIGYEFLFISDGQSLWYYTTHAQGTLTLSGGSITDYIGASGQVIDINGTYYAWSATPNAGTQDGTSAHPFLARLGSATLPDGFGLLGDPSSLSALALAINFAGVSGDDYSTAITGPNAYVTAVGPQLQTDPLTVVVTAIVDQAPGNLITTSVYSGSYLAWTGTTLAGGGGSALTQVTLPGTDVPASLDNVSSNVLVAVASSQKFYWILPGATVIDPLNFAEKESNPDNISQIVTVGDQAILAGDGSTENWYATGNFDAPFAPVEGRVYARGALEGTVVLVMDEIVLVGNDGVVYTIGYTWGNTAQYGVHRISNHGIEERIREQIRFLQGYPS